MGDPALLFSFSIKTVLIGLRLKGNSYPGVRPCIMESKDYLNTISRTSDKNIFKDNINNCQTYIINLGIHELNSGSYEWIRRSCHLWKISSGINFN